MPSLKELRNRIASVKSTQKITKAMQMVAVSKLRRAQGAVEAARPYAEQVETVLTNLAGARPTARARAFSSAAARTRRIFCSSAPASAGSAAPLTPPSSASRARRPIRSPGQGKTVKILCVGKKGYDQLRRTHERQILELIDLRAVRTINYDTAKPIADKVIGLFESGEFDVCTLFFSRFRSVIAQIPTAQQLIPPELGAKDENAPVYDYEPDEGEILTELLPRAVTVRIYRALLENAASFFGAQMSAMDNATRNAGEMVKKYTLRYNRTRQAMITKELIEIISGAEAL